MANTLHADALSYEAGDAFVHKQRTMETEKSKLLRVSYSRSKLHLVPYTLVFAVARGGRECDAPKWAFLPVSINLLPRNF